MSTTRVHPAPEHSCCHAKPEATSAPPTAQCASGAPDHEHLAHKSTRSMALLGAGAAPLASHCTV